MLLTSSLGVESVVQLLSVLFIFVAILFGALFVTKWVASFQGLKNRNSNMELVESFRINQTKYIAIVRIGKKYLAVAIGKDEINLLCELNEDELTFQEVNKSLRVDFGSMLERLKKTKADGEKIDEN